jgi:O-acetyl-ADP-ribose deacetylase (regulator of RNase III)
VDQLSQCYSNSLNLAVEHGLRSIAFPCISTGIYRFPKPAASLTALETVRRWLLASEKNFSAVCALLYEFYWFFFDFLNFYRNLPFSLDFY